jgi:streptogramin lyase
MRPSFARLFVLSFALALPAAAAITDTIWMVGGAGSNQVFRMAPDGHVLPGFPVTLPTAVHGVAVERTGNVWFAGSTVYRLNQNGQILNQFALTGAPLNAEAYIAIDAQGRAWITEPTRSLVTRITIATPVQVQTFALRGTGPKMITVDVNGNDIWIVNTTSQNLSKLDPSGVEYPASPFSISPNPSALAFNALGYLYVTSFQANTIARFDRNNGQLQQTINVTPYGTGVYALAIDGREHLWVTCQTSRKLVEFDATGSYVQSIDFTNTPGDVDFDANQDLWVAFPTTAGMNRVFKYGLDGRLLAQIALGQNLNVHFSVDFSGFDYVHTIDASLDNDGDLFTNAREIQDQTNPFDATSKPFQPKPILSNVAIPGAPVTVEFRHLIDAGRTYVAAAALSDTPGIELAPGRILPLNFDGLFLLSLNAPSVFSSFAGVLDQNGRARGIVNLPVGNQYVGIQFYVANIVLEPQAPQGIATISSSRMITIVLD